MIRTLVAAGARLEAGGLIEISAAHNRVPDRSDGTFDGSTGVDTGDGPGGNSVTFALAHGLSTGNVVSYDSRGLAPVGGLESGRQYGVIVPAGNTVTVQLGAAFDGASVDPLTDTITFTSAHNLETGDFVFYNAFGTAVGGLVSGRRYRVFKVDDQRIKLLDPATPEQSVTVPGSAVNGSTVTVGGGNPFGTGTPVTYHAPGPTGSFTSMLVDAQVDGNLNPVRVILPGGRSEIGTEDNNTIYIAQDRDGDGIVEDHDIQTGQALRYDTTGTPIGGLVPGHTYFAIRVDARRIRLSETVNGPAIALNPDKSPAARSVVHTLQRDRDRPLPNLVDGRVYFAVNSTGTTFQLAATPGATPIALNPGGLTGGPHTFSREGVDLTAPGSGSQRVVIDLTATSPGTHQFVGTGVGNFVAAPSGDQTVTASAAGIAIGLVDVGGSDSNAVATATVETSIGARAVLRGGRIAVASDAVVNAKALSTNGGGGAVAINDSDAVARASTNSKVSVAAGAQLIAAGDLTVMSISVVSGSSYSSPTGVGLGGFVDSNATTDLDYTTTTEIAGQLQAGGALRVLAFGGANGYAEAQAHAVGLGADADANDEGGNRGVRIGLTSATTRVDLLPTAVLTAPFVEVTGSIDFLFTYAYSRSVATALGADSDAGASSVVRGLTEVRLQAGARISGTTVVIRARYLNVDLVSFSFARCRCLGGDTDASSNVDYDTTARVTGRLGATVTAADLNVFATQQITRDLREAHARGGFLDDTDADVTGPTVERRLIFWESRVVLLAAADPELEIDRDGRITKMVNVGVHDRDGISYGLGDIIAGGLIFVDDIRYNAFGHVRLSTNDPGGPNTPPSVVWGNAMVLEVPEAFNFVHITNFSPKVLVVGPIDVASSLAPGGTRAQMEVIADTIPGPVVTPPFGTSLDENNPGTTFEFDIKHVFPRTQVEIRNLMPAPAVADSPVIIDADIINPIGRTLVENDRGAIVAGFRFDREAIIRTNIL
ncbi:MAG TPA: hypothetical protein VEK80_00720, partial [Kribbellaceae bacterium]|nr:hypothetical protein [Kribbellaceae bacterium]